MAEQCPRCGQKTKPNEPVCEKCGYVFPSHNSDSKKVQSLSFSSYGKWCKIIALMLVIVGLIVALAAGNLVTPKSVADKSVYSTSSESDLYNDTSDTSESTPEFNGNLFATIFGMFGGTAVLFLLASWHYNHQETIIQQLNLVLSQRPEAKEK